MNSKLLIVFILFFSVSIQAQVDPKTEKRSANTVPGWCECLTFVSECSGEIVTNIEAKFTTVWCDGAHSSRTFTVGESGQLCGIEGTKGECPSVGVCIDGSDWEVCEVVGCEVRLKKVLSQYPRINGQLVGYGPLSPGNSSAYKFCERIHTGALNNIHGTEEILYCSGDEAILDIQGMSISATSGYCLTVNILEGKTTVASETFSHSDANGSSVDITDLLSGLASDQIYILEMIIACCDENESACTTNARKFAYFKLLSPFSFTAMATDGAIPGPISLPFVPATSPNGTILVNTFPIPPLPFDFAAYTVTLSDVINSIGADVEYQLYDTNCSSGTGDDTAIGMPGILPGENGQAFPTIVVSPTVDCDCYRLELQYEDGCEDDKVRSNYYFQVGPDCMEGFTTEYPHQRRSDILPPSSFKAKIKGNPVHDEIILELFTPKTLSTETIAIKVYDISGQLITSQLTDGATSHVRIPFDEISGTYLYTIEANGERLTTGKLVKE